MIVQCRPSASRKVTVSWEILKKERERIGRRFLEQWVWEPRSKEFETFADANGFALGLQKREIYVRGVELF